MPTSCPLPNSLYGTFTKSSCPLYVFGGMLSKESVYREQCVTNVGILHKPADSVPLSMQEVTQEGTLCCSIHYARSGLSAEEERERFGS